MQNPSCAESPRIPNVFVRPTESWSVYQARLLHLLEEAGVRPRTARPSRIAPEDEEAVPAGRGASGRP